MWGSTVQWFLFVLNALYLPLFYFSLPVCPPMYQKKPVSFKTPLFPGEWSAVLSSTKLIKVIQEKCVRNRHVTSESLQIRVLVCSPWDVLLTPLLFWRIFTQYFFRTFMRLPHIYSSGKNTLKVLFPQEKVSVLITNEQVRYMTEITLQKCFHFLTKSL